MKPIILHCQHVYDDTIKAEIGEGPGDTPDLWFTCQNVGEKPSESLLLNLSPATWRDFADAIDRIPGFGRGPAAEGPGEADRAAVTVSLGDFAGACGRAVAALANFEAEILKRAGR